MVRVLLAVTHQLLRAALLEYLGAGEFVCGEAAGAEELWDHLWHSQWDVLILDLCLPQHTKVQTVRTVHDRYPSLPILTLSFAVDIPTRCWQDAGASGFVSKATLSADLIEAVKVISRGGKYFSDQGPQERTP
jgi:two-component system, NarL family, invasion response regulator UvrY